MCLCVSLYIYTYFNYATMILADFRLESKVNMEGTIQRKSFLSNDDIELVETQHLTSETTTLGIPGQNHLQNSSSDHCTGMFTSSLYTLPNTNTLITLGNLREEKFCWVRFLCLLKLKWYANSNIAGFFLACQIFSPQFPLQISQIHWLAVVRFVQPIPSELIAYMATHWYSHSRDSGERCVQLPIGQYNQYRIGDPAVQKVDMLEKNWVQFLIPHPEMS